MSSDYGSYKIGTWREYVREVSWVEERRFPLEPASTALVVVDMTLFQCDKAAPFGVARTLHMKGGRLADYYFGGLDRVVLAIRSTIDFFRDNHMQVVFLTQGPYLTEGRDLPFHIRRSTREYLQVPGARESTLTPQFEIIPELEPQKDDLVLHKITNSGFAGTSLDLVLRNLGIDSLVLTGAATDGCVEATARAGADLGYKIVLMEDACLTQSPLFHDVTMMHCVQLWGRVLNSEQAIAELAERITLHP